jgi:hypothetical protein
MTGLDGSAAIEDRILRRVGGLVEDAAERHRWRETVVALHRLSQPGGALEGWLFHGTDAEAAASIALEGVRTTDCETGKESRRWSAGTHWGTASVASFFAEDRIESLGRQVGLVIFAARIEDIGGCGPLGPDGQMLDCPLWSRMPMAEPEAWTAWDSGERDWRSCLDIFGCLVCLGPVGPEVLRMVTSTEDALRLAESVRSAANPAIC